MARFPFKKFALKFAGVAEPYYFTMSINPEWITGIQEFTAVRLAETKEKNKPNLLVAELLRSKVAQRLQVGVKAGSSLKYHSVLVAGDKAVAAETELLGKSFGGGEIVTVIGKRSATFK